MATAEVAKAPKNATTDIQPVLDQLDSLRKNGVSSENYAGVGMQLYKLGLLLDYLRLVATLPSAPSPAQPAATAPQADYTRPSLKERLKEKRAAFLDELQLSCWESMQAARRRLSELQSNTFSDDLKKEIEAYPQGVDIKTNPPVPHAEEPTELSVSFYRPEYEQSAARDELFCTWTFLEEPAHKAKSHKLAKLWRRLRGKPASGNSQSGVERREVSPAPRRSEPRTSSPQESQDAPEKGWTVWHFFPAGKQIVTVKIRDAAGKVLISKNQACPPNENGPTLCKTFTLEGKSLSRAGHHRFNIELLQFLISLLVVVVALMEGAIQKIDAQDPLTVIATLFGIGFAANTVKNLIAPPPTKS